MRLLLDTSTFLWWITDSPRISPRARELVSEGENEVFFSVASAWEIALKARLGRLTLPETPEKFLVEQVVANAFQILPVHLSHALRVHSLPQHHRDPFDHLLVAQAQVEELAIVSGDPALARYPVEVIW